MSNDNTNDLNNVFAGANENIGELSHEDEEAVEKALKHIASQMAGSAEHQDIQNDDLSHDADIQAPQDEKNGADEIKPPLEDEITLQDSNNEEVLDSNQTAEDTASNKEAVDSQADSKVDTLANDAEIEIEDSNIQEQQTTKNNNSDVKQSLDIENKDIPSMDDLDDDSVLKKYIDDCNFL